MIDILNRVKNNEVVPKDITASLRELKKEAIEEKVLMEKDEFDIFGGIAQDMSKVSKIKNKKHREIAKDKFVILDITKSTKQIGYKLALEKVIENVKKALQKVTISEDLPVYKAIQEELLDEKQNLTGFQEELNTYNESRAIVGRELGVLTGQREKDLTEMQRNDYSSVSIICLPKNINAEVIQYRPDYLKAEDYLEKIGIDVKVARRDFLPKFVLYGQAGFNAYSLGNIFGNHTFKSGFGVLPVIDLFTGGAKTAHLKYKKLELEKARQIYERTILTSIQEVNNSLNTAITRDLNYKESLKRYSLEQEKFALADKKYNIGAKSVLDRMKDEKKLLNAEKDKINSQINYVISTVNIYKAVGGKDFTKIDDSL